MMTDVLSRPGRPLDPAARAFFEPRFGADFSQVRVHTGERAARSADHVAALAYTVGRDVVFAAGRYAPLQASGRALLGHELAHVVQQRGRGTPGPLRLGRAGDLPEREAVQTTRRVLTPGPALAEGVASSAARAAAVGTVLRQQAPAGAGQKVPVAPEEPSAEQWCRPFHIAGAAEPRSAGAIMRIAWTLDDGPTTFTGSMRAELGARQGTWFIMRNQLPKDPKQLSRTLAGMVKLQEEGQEFAIHAFHPTKAHAAWFPVRLSGTPKGYDRIEEAMHDLGAFVKLLRGAGLTITFVRHPGGLFSELRKYLVDRGVLTDLERTARTRRSNAEQQVKTAAQELKTAAAGQRAGAAAQRLRAGELEQEAAERQLKTVDRGRRTLVRWIIAGKDLAELTRAEVAALSGADPSAMTERDLATFRAQVSPVQRDYRTMQRTLTRLGLTEWGGSTPDEPFTGLQSWEAESSGSGLTDNVTSEFAEKVKKVVADDKPESLVVLAHDVNMKNVREVRGDIAAMEELAEEQGVRIEYYTMSGLFRCLRQEEPGASR